MMVFSSGFVHEAFPSICIMRVARLHDLKQLFSVAINSYTEVTALQQ